MIHLIIKIVAILFICTCGAAVVGLIGGIIGSLQDSKRHVERAKRERRSLRVRELEGLQRYMKRQEQEELAEWLIQAELDELLVHSSHDRYVN